MRKLFFSALVFCAVLSNAQTPQGEPQDSSRQIVEAPSAPVVGETTYELFDLENPPEFPGGEAGLMQMIAQNLNYPDSAAESNISGLVVATFVIDKGGAITNIQIIRDIGYGCGDEVRRILMLLPRWKPGIANGHPVKVRYTLPVRFKLE